MGAEYLSYVKSIATFAPTFYGYIISVLASVICLEIEDVFKFDSLETCKSKKDTVGWLAQP